MTWRILALATEWASGQGGLSTLNRQLCVALAADGAEVSCRVPAATRAEHTQAAAAGVRLIEAPAAPGAGRLDPLAYRAGLPADAPDLIIGHGRITGPYAHALAEDVFPGTPWYLVTHTIPDESEWQRRDQRDIAGERAERRTRLEWTLGRAATRVVTVGPRLYERAQVQLSAYTEAPDPLQLDPGFDDVTPARCPPRGGPVQILISGRLHDGVKGVDIVARALRPALALADLRVSDIELVARGTDSVRAADFREEIQRLAGLPGLRVIPRTYTADVEYLREDLLRATLFLMPSRAEPFGLAGLEAIVAGTPVLVSDRSGLSDLLSELVPDQARRLVVPVSDDDTADADAWGRAIATVIRDPAAAFANIEATRQVLAAKRTWAMAAAQVLDSLAVLAGR